jgi:hypothetical protein
MNLRVKSSTLAMEKYQVIHGQTVSRWLPAPSLWLTTTIVKAILIVVKGRKQRQKSPSATEAKINLLAFKAQWHLVTTILLRMKPGPPVPQESHLYQSFFSRAASTKFTIALINSYIAQMPSVPTRYLKHPADSAIHPHVQHLGFLRSLGLEIPGPKQSCSKWLQFADMLRWPFKHVHLKVQKLPVEIWRMFVIFCKFQMDLCGFPQGRFAMNACGNWMKRYA